MPNKKKWKFKMYNLRLGISLFSVSSVLCTFLWFATAPDFSLGQPSLVTLPSGSAEAIDTPFIRQMKASLKEDAAWAPVEDKTRLVKAPKSKGVSVEPVRNRGLLHKASFVNSYGVNEEFIKNACSEFAKRSP
jgi:hypothetical protein